MSAICLHTFCYLPWSATKTNMTENSYWHIKTTLSNMKNMLVFWENMSSLITCKGNKNFRFSSSLELYNNTNRRIVNHISITWKKYWESHIHWDVSICQGKWIIGITTLIRFYDRKMIPAYIIFIHDIIKVYFDDT